MKIDGKNTVHQCIDKCIHKKISIPSINGVVVTKTEDCFCEKGIKSKEPFKVNDNKFCVLHHSF